MKEIFWFIWFLPRNLLILFLKLYRKIISPLYGEVCKYYPSCSKYALESVTHKGVLKGSIMSAWRILRCNPWSHGGVDEIEADKNANFRVTELGIVVWDGPLRALGENKDQN